MFREAGGNIRGRGMSLYSRHAFRAWLHTLPPDAPFCSDCNCPITEFMLTKLGRDGFDNLAAQNLDPHLADAIDNFCRSDVPTFCKWRRLTPRECISLIDEVEARAA